MHAVIQSYMYLPEHSFSTVKVIMPEHLPLSGKGWTQAGPQQLATQSADITETAADGLQGEEDSNFGGFEEFDDGAASGEAHVSV